MALKRSRSAGYLSISFALIQVVASTTQVRAQTTAVTQSGTTASEAQATQAPLFTYGVDAGVGESDNVSLVSSNKVSQTISTADVDFTVKDQTRLLDVNAVGNFSDLSYLQGAYGNQLLGRFDGTGDLVIVPGRLIWTVRDDFGQSSIDPYTSVTPDNIENINYFSTGPDLSLRFSGVNFVNLSARYARAQYETSPFNSNRFLGSIAAGRDISAGAALSLNVESERVVFADTVVNDDFTRTSGFVRYELHGARTDLEADAGATTINQAGSTTGALAKVQLSRQISPSARVIATAGRELTDWSSSFSTLQNGSFGGVSGVGGLVSTPLGTGGIIGAAPPALTSDNYTSDYGSLGWQYQRNRTTLTVTARWEKDSYTDQSQLNVTHPAADFTLTRVLSRSLTLDLLGRWYRTDYVNVFVASSVASSDYNDWLLGGALTWRYGRGLEVRLRYDHNAHVVAAGGSGYAENRLFVTVGFRPRAITND